MKKLITILAAVITTAFVFAPTSAEAGPSYKKKTIGKCSHCNGSVVAYYKPVSYRNGSAIYNWVPSYHNTCRAQANRHRNYRSSHRYEPYRRSYSYSYGRSSNSCR